MDKLAKYQRAVTTILTPYSRIKYANANVRNRLAYDHEHLQYLVISEGWQAKKRFHSCLIHLEIIKGKVWIQCDNTEDGIANELISAGIPKEDIVLGFHEPEVRRYTEFANCNE